MPVRVCLRLFVLVCLLLPSLAFAQGNGRLQIHYIDVGQGDAAVLISPRGEVVLFDNGVLNQCGKPVGYLQNLGLTRIDYHIASHYHSDHIGCTAAVLSMFPLQKAAYDRGGSYTTATFTGYVGAVGSRRVTATPGGMVTLDAGSAHPVTILFVASNGNGISTTDENDRSLVALVRFGNFEAEFGGDLSGSGTGLVGLDPHDPAPAPAPPPPGPAPPSGGIPTCAKPAAAPAATTAVCKDGAFSQSQNRSGTCSTHGGVSCWVCPGKLCAAAIQGQVDASLVPVRSAAYADIETSVAPAVGRVEVYKVHHHGSRFSSNANWLSVTTPKVGIVSVGSSNTYGHPTSESLTRLHDVGTRTFWTSVGNGVAPGALDVVAGNVIVQVEPSAPVFTVAYGATTQTFALWGSAAPPANQPPFGTFDTPAAGATVAGEVAVTGWALDDVGVSGVSLYRTPVSGEAVHSNGLVFIGNATFVAGARPDVASGYGTYPQSGRAGWGYMLLSNMLPDRGNGTFTLSAFGDDASGARTLLGHKTVVLANSTNVKPFGTIDTPAQGATVSGVIDNFGWALTPTPATIPVDGSTITIYVDRVPVGRPTYNLFRSDIASVFPGHANSAGAVGHFRLDTTILSDGVHELSWVVVDSLGNASGIGSRYFTVANR